MKSGSGRWNQRHPERVKESRDRYKKKMQDEKARRDALTPLERAKEDVESILAPLSPSEQRTLASWVGEWIVRPR